MESVPGAEEHLEQRARQREEPAAGEGGERPGRSATPQRIRARLVAAAEQRVGELRRAEVDAAERDRERKARGNQRDDQNGDGLHRD